uniref:NADH-ubiquinone oxidoreductase chain 4L n=1 Tax=Ptilonyssus chloris TaxID=2652178 RepID=A0A5Q0RZ15_9ACAR|nr:NADH dehydrogenase subunit 4L [Ptilonyssus chloris]QGA47493.1 NADH dehydrogenase subunit 4L [Ptilonyssus chloris]
MFMMLWVMGLMCFVINRYSLMMMLLSMELMSISLFYQLLMFSYYDSVSMIMIYIVMMVLEACMGLTMLVMMVYYYGCDFINNKVLFIY